MTFFRRFYLEQNIFEYEPTEMVFVCLYLASKTDEITFGDNHIKVFVDQIAEPKYCNVESLKNLEISLVKVLRFQFLVYSPFQLMDYMIGIIESGYARATPEISVSVSLNIGLLKKAMLDQMVRCYQLEFVVFMYTPSHMALASLDVAITQLS